MTATIEQLITRNQASMHVLKSLSHKVFTGYEKLMDLNLGATKALIAGAYGHAINLMAAKTPQELLELQRSLVKPLKEKTATYGWDVYETAADTGRQVNQFFEDEMMETHAAFTDMLDQLTKTAPNGTESAVALLKNAMDAGQYAIKEAQSSARKAIKVAESNMTEMTHHEIHSTATAVKVE